MMEWNGFDKGGRRTKGRRSPGRGEREKERLWMSAWRAGFLSSPLRPPDTHQSHNNQQQLICGAHFLAECRIEAADVDGTSRDPLGNDTTEKEGRRERARRPSTSPAEHFKVEITTK